MVRGLRSLLATRAALPVLVGTLAVLFTGTLVYAAVTVVAPDPATGIVHACYDSGGKGAGRVRLVSAGTTCKSSETAVSWRTMSSIGQLEGTACDVDGTAGTVAMSTAPGGAISFVCEVSGGGGGGGGGAQCGDGEIDPGEQCDDGDAEGGDGCSSTCDVESGWQCTGEPTVCAEVCGDGQTVGSEACDDGNEQTESSCPYGTATCMTCDATCDNSTPATGPVCGDGKVDAPFEACDDGNTSSGDACSSDCNTATAP